MSQGWVLNTAKYGDTIPIHLKKIKGQHAYLSNSGGIGIVSTCLQMGRVNFGSVYRLVLIGVISSGPLFPVIVNP
jgi:hypothetical protein